MTPKARSQIVRIVAPLSITQIIGWGTTYYLPTTLAAPLAAELGLEAETTFAGVTVMLVTSALAAPRFGRLIDRHGVRWPMTAGSVLFALNLMLLAFVSGPIGYLAAWIIGGVAVPLALTQAATAAMAQLDAARARQSIGILMLMGGLSSTVFWPLTAWLEARYGWRAVCLIFAASHIVLCAPIHALVLAGIGRLEEPAAEGSGLPLPAPTVAPAERRRAFMLMALAFALTGFVSWGLPLHIIAILQGYGHTAAFAVLIGALMGPAQVSARLIEILFGSRLGILKVGVASAAIMPLAVLLPVVGGPSGLIAAGFVVGYGLAAGAMTIVRNVAPLILFGRETYATMMGWLALPQNMAYATSPMIFAAAVRQFGPTAALVVALAAALAALAVMIVLERRYGRDPAAPAP